MAHFLWVEDFPGDNSTRSTTEALFGNYLKEHNLSVNYLSEDPRILRNQLKPHGIHIETNFYDGYCFIHNKLNKVDFVILDIDLPCDNGYLSDAEYSEITGLLNTWKHLKENDYDNEEAINKAQAELKKIAGYHLYTELVINIGFPKENILFCSNHGDELKAIKEAFGHAKIDIPEVYTKSEAHKLQQFVEEKNNIPYFNLRRGIFLAAGHYKPQLVKNKHMTRFSQQWNYEQGTYKNAYFSHYLSLLEIILPMREPKSKKHTYKLLLRTIVHNWDQTTEKIEKKDNEHWFSLVKILNNCRNWSAHNRKIFNDIPENFLAFIFLVHIRATFKCEKELARYEKQLLPLLGKPLDKESFEQKVEAIDHILVQIYKETLHMTGDKDGFYDNLINKLQQQTNFNPPYGNYDTFFQTALYRMLWFLLAQNYYQFKLTKLNPERSDLEFFIQSLEPYIYQLSFPNQ